MTDDHTNIMGIQPYQCQPPAQWKPPGSGLAVASMILGITSVVFCWWGLATLAMWLCAVIFAGVSMHKATVANMPRNGMAVAGLVLGIVGGLTYLTLGIFSLGVMLVL